MFVPRTLHDFGDLVMLFNERKLPLRVDNERRAIESGPLRLRWDHPFLHVTRPICTAVSAERVAAIEHAIVTTNHASQLPVLDFDASTGTVAFRVTTPILVDGVRIDLLDALLAGAEARVVELQALLAPLAGASAPEARAMPDR